MNFMFLTKKNVIACRENLGKPEKTLLVFVKRFWAFVRDFSFFSFKLGANHLKSNHLVRITSSLAWVTSPLVRVTSSLARVATPLVRVTSSNKQLTRLFPSAQTENDLEESRQKLSARAETPLPPPEQVSWRLLSRFDTRVHDGGVTSQALTWSVCVYVCDCLASWWGDATLLPITRPRPPRGRDKRGRRTRIFDSWATADRRGDPACLPVWRGVHVINGCCDSHKQKGKVFFRVFVDIFDCSAYHVISRCSLHRLVPIFLICEIIEQRSKLFIYTWFVVVLKLSEKLQNFKTFFDKPLGVIIKNWFE